MREIVDRDEPITREVWNRDEAIAALQSTIGETYKAEIIHGCPTGEDDHGLPPGRLEGPVPRPAPAVDGQLGKAFKLTKLAGAYWRGDQATPSCSASTARPGPPTRTSRPTSSASRRPRSATTASIGKEMDLFHHAGRGRGHGVLAPQGLDAVAHARGLYAPPAGRRRLCRGQDAAAARPRALGEVGPLGEVPRRTCSSCETARSVRRARSSRSSR